MRESSFLLHTFVQIVSFKTDVILIKKNDFIIIKLTENSKAMWYLHIDIDLNNGIFSHFRNIQ